MQNDVFHRLSRLLLLKHPQDTQRLLAGLEYACGDGDIIQRLMKRNDTIFAQKVKELGCAPDASAQEIYEALKQRMAHAEQEFTNLIDGGTPGDVDNEDIKTMMKLAHDTHAEIKGFFLKPIKAKQLLRAYPPIDLMRILGYTDVATLLKKEDIFEIFAALRFTEDKIWMNGLLSLYTALQPSDFEHRAIKTLVLDPKKWYRVARKFIKKKYHNLSHSKEMGVIFLIPIPGQFEGLNLRALVMLLHYFWEVTFYSRLFMAKARSNRHQFGEELVAAITGDMPKMKKTGATLCWYIMQRYLAKDPRKDWRFYEPHVMPEALHWRRAFMSLARLRKRYAKQLPSLAFWDHDMDWMAKQFGANRTSPIVTLNFEDILFSYAQKLPFNKYYKYHWRESLWNKVFASYAGEECMEECMLRDLREGKICEFIHHHRH